MTATTAERKKETMNCKSRGRQKIEIKRIDKESSRQTTFSKRRGGLFNKASELCLLCGAEAAILVFSPSGNRVYSFSTSPSSVDSILQRFIRGGGGGGGVVPDEPADADHHEAAAEEEACRVGELKRQYLELLNQLEAEKKKRSRSHLGGHDQEEEEGAAWWWEAPIDDGMGLIELGQLKMRLEDLQNRVANRAHQLAAAHNGGHHGDDHDDGSAGFSFS